MGWLGYILVLNEFTGRGARPANTANISKNPHVRTDRF